jgi:APA family basic amino acid/polyamine antiporter
MTLIMSIGLAILCKGGAEFLAGDKSAHSETYKIALTVIGALITLATTIYFFRQPTHDYPTTFACPFVPVVPILGMGFNIFLMVQLNSEAWIRLFIWLAIGFTIYFFYGRTHSKLSPHYQGDPDAADDFVLPDATH